MHDVIDADARQPWERLRDLGERLAEAVPPVDPPGCHWLTSDAGTSLCWECARKAAWAEMGRAGDLPAEGDWWKRTRVEEAIRDRIDGPSWGESDSGEACSNCGCTLSHLLTDGGRNEELAHFAENPIGPEDHVDGELSYTLSRIFMNLDVPGADETRTMEAIRIAEDALAAVAAQGRAPVKAA